jgi:hypothetical protein
MLATCGCFWAFCCLGVAPRAPAIQRHAAEPGATLPGARERRSGVGPVDVELALGEKPRADQLFAYEDVNHAAVPGTPPGPEGQAQLMERLWHAFPDAHFSVEHRPMTTTQ